MYEYKCSNLSCSQVWTIDEGNIGTLYLTCPHCNKGKGIYLRQIKSKPEFEQFMKKKPDSIEEKGIIEKTTKANDDKKEENVKIDADKIEKTSKKTKNDRKIIENEDLQTEQQVDNSVLDNQVDINQIEKNIYYTDEDDIFNRIIQKRKLQEEFIKDSDENIDILEIAGDSIEEIERRIKEFEEFYYIKVVDKSIVKHGERYNCILKYHKK